MKLFVSMLFVLFITLAAVAPAYAAPPITETETEEDTYQIYDCSEYGKDFVITNHEVSTSEYTYFVDNDGNVIKVAGHVRGMNNFYVEGHSDTVVSGAYLVNFYFAERGELITFNSAGNWHINLPGYGNVIHSAGLGVNDTSDWSIIKEAGIQYEDLDTLCEYLDPSS